MFFSSVWFTWIFTHTFSKRFIRSPLSVSSFCTFILFHWDFQFSLRLSKQDRTCLCSIGISYRTCSNLAANFPVMGFQLRSVMSWTETNQSSIVYIWVQDIYLSNNLLLVLLPLTVSCLTPSCVILRRVKGPFAGKCRHISTWQKEGNEFTEMVRDWIWWLKHRHNFLSLYTYYCVLFTQFCVTFGKKKSLYPYYNVNISFHTCSYQIHTECNHNEISHIRFQGLCVHVHLMTYMLF